MNTLVVDVDGVLTDGAIHVHENGTQSVRLWSRWVGIGPLAGVGPNLSPSFETDQSLGYFLGLP